MYFPKLTTIALTFLLSACAPSPREAQESTSTPEPVTEPVLSPVDGFDFPVGPPTAKGYYNAQKFRVNGHLGEDWNGKGGGNSDLGDPVFSCAAGRVKRSRDRGAGWGNVTRVLHNIGTMEEPQIIESLYAHLDTLLVAKGDILSKGQQIGTIGDAHGSYYAHLHFEMRDNPNMKLGGGYDSDAQGFLHPTKFIQNHRKRPFHD